MYGARILSTYQQASGNVFEVLDELMDAYENLGSRMPSLKGWERIDGKVVQHTVVHIRRHFRVSQRSHENLLPTWYVISPCPYGSRSAIEQF